MQIYLLHFDSGPNLTRAFDTILSSSDVESCMVESGSNRIRFLAPRPAAEKIIERIYQDRGLLWCSRHGVTEPAETDPA